jgi:hypothetical protein
MTEKEQKLIRLAFDPRTPEGEATAAFLKIKELKLGDKILGGQDGSKRVVTLTGIPVNLFVASFELLHIGEERNIKGIQVKLKRCAQNPTSALVSDLEVSHIASPENNRIMNILCDKVIEMAKEQIRGRVARMATTEPAPKAKPREVAKKPPTKSKEEKKWFGIF